MYSLQTRLGAGLLLSLVLLFFAQWLVVSLSAHRLTEEYVASSLERGAESLLAALEFGADGQPVLDPAHVGPVYHRPFSGHYYHIAVGGQVLRSRSLWDIDLNPPIGREGRSHVLGPQGQPLLVLVSHFTKDGHPIAIAVAEDLSRMQAGVRKFQWRYGLVSLAALVLLILIQRWIVRTSLLPLERVRRDMARLERGEIAQLDSRVPAEVRPLVQEINRMMVIAAQRLQRYRNALGNLAHALKTPLMLLMQLGEEDEMRAHPSVKERLVRQVDTIRVLMERELKRARLAGGGVWGRSFDPATEIPPLLDALKSIYRDKRLEIDSRIPAGMLFPVDRQDMLELLGNLLDNACKWAHRRVLLTVEQASSLSMVVEDDGPGCPAEELEQLAQRGVRIDESASGHGLGLAIVRDVVENYGGSLRFGRSAELGGFMVRVWLPEPQGAKETALPGA